MNKLSEYRSGTRIISRIDIVAISKYGVLAVECKSHTLHVLMKSKYGGGSLMGAYCELYLMDTTDLIEAVFRVVSEEDKWDFEKFTAGFMGCKYRRLIDTGSARAMNMAIDEFISYLHKDCSDIFVEGKCEVDPLLALWIGGMYNRIQFYSCKPSYEIYNKLPLDRMIQLFEPLHTVSDDIAVEKLLNWL